MGGFLKDVNPLFEYPNSIMLVLKVGIKNAQTHQVLQIHLPPPVFELHIDFPHQCRFQHPAADSSASTGPIKTAPLYS